MQDLEGMLLYAMIQLVVNYVVYRAVKAQAPVTRFGIFLSALVVGLTAATTTFGFLGTILGGPSVLMASISLALILPVEKKK